jgi:hypothetical protein
VALLQLLYSAAAIAWLAVGIGIAKSSNNVDSSACISVLRTSADASVYAMLQSTQLHEYSCACVYVSHDSATTMADMHLLQHLVYAKNAAPYREHASSNARHSTYQNRIRMWILACIKYV